MRASIFSTYTYSKEDQATITIDPFLKKGGHFECPYCPDRFPIRFGSLADYTDHLKRVHQPEWWWLKHTKIRENHAVILPSEKSEVLKNTLFGQDLQKPLGGFGLNHTLNWVFDPDFSQHGHSFKEAGRYTLDGWYFPGQGGTPYATCGTIHYKGCLNPAHGGQAGARKIQDNCHRATCPICSDQWLMSTTKKIEHRIEAYVDVLRARGARHKRPIHVTVNPPPKLWDAFKNIENFNKLRRKAQLLARKAGFKGGVIIYHQKRERCGDCGGKILFKQKKCAECGAYHIVWYFSPHFHLLGFGFITGTASLFDKFGWVIKNHGIRSDVGATAYYQLSHCSIHAGKHTLVWFGDLHYSKFMLLPPELSESDIAENECPICGHKLRLMYYYGSKPPPIGDGVTVIDSTGWVYAKG